jgi:hypothetical protein
LPSENLAARWTKSSFDSFVQELTEAKAWVEDARITDDLVEAVEAWREVLGEGFPAPDTQQLGLSLADTSHEQNFAAKGWRYAPDPRYSITIKASQQRGKMLRTRKPYPNNGPAVFAGHRLRFQATRVSPGHSEVWWQVTNTGPHASHVNGLRGGFVRARSINDTASRDPLEHWENTAYSGTHRVRAVLVRDDVVVAVSNWLNVNIWSKNWRAGRGLR